MNCIRLSDRLATVSTALCTSSSSSAIGESRSVCFTTSSTRSAALRASDVTGVIEFMAGALDDPERYTPIRNHGAESKLDWPDTLATLPSRDTVFSNGETVTSYQHEPGE